MMTSDFSPPVPAGAGPATATQSTHPAPERAHVASSTLWFGLFGGPVAWSVQTLVNLPLASHACFPRLFPLDTPATSGLRGIVFLVSIVAVIVSIAAAASAWGAWRRTRHEQQEQSGQAKQHQTQAALLETGEGRTRFMALAGVMTSVTFVLVSAVHLSAVFLVTPCAS